MTYFGDLSLDTNESVLMTIADIAKILKRLNLYQELIRNVYTCLTWDDADLVGFILHTNNEEDHGVKSLEETRRIIHGLNDVYSYSPAGVSEGRETINLWCAYKHLLKERSQETDHSLHGMLEISMIQEAHKLLFQGISLPKGSSKPGVISSKIRTTSYKGEFYRYRHTDDMEESFRTLLDRYNTLACDVYKENNIQAKLMKLFSSCAFLVFELLDLHPFSDGNGRMSRLLCGYILSSVLFISIPLIDTEFTKFIDILVRTRQNPQRTYSELTVFIINNSRIALESFICTKQNQII